MPAKDPKRHHYVPEFLLRNFVFPTDGKTLWRYEKPSGREIQTCPHDAACQKHYYRRTLADGSKDDSLEKALADAEGETAPIVARVLARQPISPQQWDHLAFFLALMMVRVPAFRDQTMAQGQDILLIKDIFLRMRWAFLEAPPGSQFLISDNPLCYCVPDATFTPLHGVFGVGLATRAVEITFPLAKNMAWLATWNGPAGGPADYRVAADGMVEELNQRLIDSAERYVYSSRQSLQIQAAVRASAVDARIATLNLAVQRLGLPGLPLPPRQP